jgi:predicted anti-sigma-YlaC factor YlaD
LAESGSTFASDDDPELVKAAVPFSLKLMESLLAESPRHKGLLLATTSGFTQFSYAFVQLEADQVEVEDFERAEAMRDRARRLYLRARDYGLRGLEVAHRGFRDELFDEPELAVRRARKKDVPLLYWTALAWGAAISVSKDDPHRVAELPQLESLIDRALELEEGYGDGAIHTFLITYEMSREGASGDPVDRARHHLERAVELSGGMAAGPWVTYAESVCVQEQDLEGFERALASALAIDPDAQPESRLINIIMQQRAHWLQSRREELFLILEGPNT